MNPTRRRVALFFLLVVPSAVLGSLHSPEVARSFPIYPPLLPNRAAATASDNTSQPCITCHNNPNGGQGCASFPCLNSFGVAFMGAGHVWSPALATLDSDGDGYTNGQELQDPSGNWTVDLVDSPGVATHVTLPGFDSMNLLPSFLSEYSPGLSDVDQDGYCWFGQDMNGDHDCLDSGEKLINAIDCDDNSPAVNSTATELCTNTIDDDCNGLDTLHDPVCAAIVDADHDGYCPTGKDLNADHDCIDAGENTADIDCNDANLLIRPGAAENCQDTLDNDCDTFIDILDSNCTGEGDFDNDGYCPIGQDSNDDGDCLDAAESALPSDCNDQDANVNPGKVEVCGNLQDDDCDQLADFSDVDCATFADADDDGYCNVGKDVNGDGDCADAVDIMNVAQGYDCDDTVSTIFSVATEVCTDLVDQDCDGAPALTDPDCANYLDQDHDDFCPVGGIDLNNDFDCADAGEFSFLYDCLDVAMVGWPAPALVKPTATEVCTNGVDDNCNGIADASATGSDPACLNFEDSDFDGYCHPGTDVNVDGDCADASEQTASDDTAPNDPTVSPGNHESCYDMRDNDLDGLTDLADTECVNTHDTDGDGYCPIGKDVNADGDCSDPGENFKLSDCDDGSAAIGPQMAEVYVEGALVQRCFDGDDNDCNGNWDTGQRGDTGCGYLYDRDGDGVCGHGLDDNGDGDCVDTDEQRFGDDCDDDDPVRASSLIEACADQVDNDCNDLVDAADPSCQCQLASQCTQATTCQIAVCNQGVCQYNFDPDCTDAGPRRGGGGLFCGISAGTAAAPSLLAGFTLLAAALAIFARRGGRALRAARNDRSGYPRRG